MHKEKQFCSRTVRVLVFVFRMNGAVKSRLTAAPATFPQATGSRSSRAEHQRLQCDTGELGHLAAFCTSYSTNRLSANSVSKFDVKSTTDISKQIRD